MNNGVESRQRFLEEYRCIRHAEGRGSDSSEYYCALPFTDTSGTNAEMWAMRARTYLYFQRNILHRIERREKRQLDILDLGAGNCWLSYRLSLRRHRPVALDIFCDEKDGLHAARHYPTRFPVVEADFDRLPFGSATFDLAVFNASVHYSTDYLQTLSEARRCLRPHGKLIILDSPIYRTREDGVRMVKEKHLHFLKQYGFASDAIPSIEFLDESMLKGLADALAIRWKIHRPWYGWRWHLRPLHALFERRRRPSRFWILIGTFQ